MIRFLCSNQKIIVVFSVFFLDLRINLNYGVKHVSLTKTISTYVSKKLW